MDEWDQFTRREEMGTTDWALIWLMIGVFVYVVFFKGPAP